METHVRWVGWPVACVLAAVLAFSSQPASGQTFTSIWGSLPTTTGGHGAMWADVEHDGLPDLYLPLNRTPNLRPDLFIHNEGSGTFLELGAARGIDDTEEGSHGAVFADLDNDGDYDLVNGTTYAPNNQNDVFRNNGLGFFTEMMPTAIETRKEVTRGILTFDMDGDGDLDIFAVTNWLGTNDPVNERNEVFRNDGNFQFTSITSGALYTAPAAQGATDTDYDGDGRVDILAGNGTGPFNILHNDGSGNFSLVTPSSIGLPDTAGVASAGITTGDVNNDGHLDMILGRNDSGVLYLNDGDGTFTHHQDFADTDGYMGGLADLDHDGDLDLIFPGDEQMYVNDGSGNFSAGNAIPDIDNAIDPRAIAFADIDDDGDLDFAVAIKSAGNELFRNNLDSGNWLKVELESPDGQAGAFGAKVFLYAAGDAGGTLLGMREAQSNYGYLAQDDPILHFGLGELAEVDVVVEFLGGTQMIFRNIAGNQTVQLPEPATLTVLGLAGLLLHRRRRAG